MMDYILHYLYGIAWMMFSAFCLVVTWSMIVLPAAVVWLIVKVIGKIHKAVTKARFPE